MNKVRRIMKVKKHSLLTCAGICLLLLALLSTGYAAYSSFRMKPGAGAGFVPMQGEDVSGERPQPPDDLKPGTGQTPPQGEINREDFRGLPPTNGNFPNGKIMLGGFAPFGWLSFAIYIVALVAAIIAALGIFNSKKWGAIMAIIVAAVLLVSGVLGLFRVFGWPGIVVSVLKVLLAVAVIILLVLPSARTLYVIPKSQKVDDDDDDDEDEKANPISEKKIEAVSSSGPEGRKDDTPLI
jgi:uncharacterized membrane protein (UPF0136 family)